MSQSSSSSRSHSHSSSSSGALGHGSAKICVDGKCKKSNGIGTTSINLDNEEASGSSGSWENASGGGESMDNAINITTSSGSVNNVAEVSVNGHCEQEILSGTVNVNLGNGRNGGTAEGAGSNANGSSESAGGFNVTAGGSASNTASAGAATKGSASSGSGGRSGTAGTGSADSGSAGSGSSGAGSGSASSGSSSSGGSDSAGSGLAGSGSAGSVAAGSGTVGSGSTQITQGQTGAAGTTTGTGSATGNIITLMHVATVKQVLVREGLLLPRLEAVLQLKLAASVRVLEGTVSVWVMGGLEVWRLLVLVEEGVGWRVVVRMG